MANQDPQKVFVSFAGKSVTGWGEDGPTIQRAERVQTKWGLQGYAESQQHYDGDRTITMSLYVSSEGYKYIKQCYYNHCYLITHIYRAMKPTSIGLCYLLLTLA